MAPEFNDGDFVIIKRNPHLRIRFSIGDSIVFKHELYGTLIKKIEIILPNGDFFVKGNQENSLGSDKLGIIPSSIVEGKVIWRIHR